MPTSINNLLSRMSDLEHQSVERTLKELLYGPPGGGKTTLAIGQAQQIRTDEGLIAYVDSAEGWVSLDNVPALKENVIRLPYQEKSDLFALAEGIKRKQGKLAKVEVVVIDELSSIADDILDSVVRERTSTPKGEALPEVEGKDYRPMGDTIRAALNEFAKAGVHIILIAHDNEKRDKQRTTYSPSLSPKLKQMVQGLMHVTGRVTAEIGGTPAKPVYSRYVQAAPSALIEAKTRIGRLRESTKITFADFTDIVTDWVLGEEIEEDLANDENHELVPDEIGVDGIPENFEGDPTLDDEGPAYVGTDD